MILGMIGEKNWLYKSYEKYQIWVRKIYEAFLRYEAIRTYVPPPHHGLLL